MSHPPSAALRTARGRPLPLGVSSAHDGLNFALLCRHGTARHARPLRRWTATTPLAEIALHPPPQPHRRPLARPASPACRPTFRYGWRVDGPPGAGHRFDPTMVLLDPAATALSGGGRLGRPAARPTRSAPSRRSLYYRRPRYDWHEDAPPLDPAGRHRSSTSCTSAASPCHPSVGRPPPRHLRRPDREDPLPEVRWASRPSSCCRSTSSTRTTARSSTR